MDNRILKGNIFTMTGEGIRAEAAGITDGVIKAVGTLEGVKNTMPTGTEVTDYGNSLIVPGLVDTHMHPLVTGLTLSGVDLSEARSLGEVITLLSRRAKDTRPGEWVIGTRFQDKRLEERRFPTLEELDELTLRHPVMVLHNDIHFLQMNTPGMKRLFPGVSKAGSPPGYFEDPEAVNIIEGFMEDLSPEEKVDYMRDVCSLAPARGLTGLHVKEVWENLKPLLEIENSLNIRLKPMVFALSTEDPGIEAVLEDPILRRRAVICLINDGTLDGHTAALLEPYTDQPEIRAETIFSDTELERFLRRAFDAGVQASIHAVGDATIEQILRVTERVLPDFYGIDHRLRIEHFEMPAPGQIERAVRLGITAGVQPMFIPVCQGMDYSGYRPFVGDRVYRANTFKSYMDAGMLIAGGSDSPVTPLDPFQGIAAALCHPTPEERLSFYEALSLYTTKAARIAFEENSTGTIEPGKQADLTVIEYNHDSDGVLPGKEDLRAVYRGGIRVFGAD
ncbi:MAG: amidohydrolase [Spirochaetales bacterium]|nr:amidohydrolase [Spirochaetales bacterium]